MNLQFNHARTAGSDGSVSIDNVSASDSAGPGFDPSGVVNFHLKIWTSELGGVDMYSF